MQLTPLELMECHIRSLYCLDSHARLRCVNEIGEPPAPRFYMGRTLQGNYWHFRHDLPADLAERLDRLCRAEPVATDLAQPPQNRAAIQALLHDHAPLNGEYRGPAYWIPHDTLPPANVVLLSQSNAHLVRATFPWLLSWIGAAESGPIAAVIEQERAISVCFCSRRPNRATEAGVETLAAFRGRGFATSAVAAWAAEVRRQGIIPLYSTSWDNHASQSIARKLNMIRYGEDWSIQ
jgi:RimJ/RimL family protein N-acetyltransferase